MKKVIYNGGTESYYACSNPANLVVGQEYEVVFQRVKDWQTNYILKEVSGEYNSSWFEEISCKQKTYMGVSEEIPVIGEKYMVKRLYFENGVWKMKLVATSLVKSVETISEGMYKVKTQNSIYVVAVGK